MSDNLNPATVYGATLTISLPIANTSQENAQFAIDAISNMFLKGRQPAASAGDDDEGDEGAPQLDSAGLPWDERIHSSKRTVNDDGRWKKRRGVSEQEMARVEAELRQKFPAQAPTIQTPAAPTIQTPATPTIQTPAAPVIQTPAAQTPYQKFVAFLTKNTGPHLTKETLDASFASVGGLAALATADQATLDAWTEAFAAHIASNGGTVVE